MTRLASIINLTRGRGSAGRRLPNPTRSQLIALAREYGITTIDTINVSRASKDALKREIKAAMFQRDEAAGHVANRTESPIFSRSELQAIRHACLERYGISAEELTTTPKVVFSMMQGKASPRTKLAAAKTLIEMRKLAIAQAALMLEMSETSGTDEEAVRVVRLPLAGPPRDERTP